MSTTKGQSLLELAAVIALVTVGVFFAGPTIIRSINAHFKIWDDTIQDSYSDPMVKAPLQIMPTTCVCSPWVAAPGQRCGISPCSATEHLESRLCNPAGCGQASGLACPSGPGVRCISPVELCRDDTACCDLWFDTARCGHGTNAAGDCPTSFRVTQRACGGNTTQFACRSDTADVPVDGNISCVPKCLGDYAANEQIASTKPYLPVICPNDDQNVTPPPSFIQDSTGLGIPIYPRGTGSNVCNHPNPTPLPDEKCEAYCVPDFHVAGPLCVKNCQQDFVVAMSWPRTGADDKGEVRFYYKLGKIRHFKNQNKDVPLNQTAPISITVADGRILTQDYAGNGGDWPAGRLMTLPGDWSLITGATLIVSNLNRGTNMLQSISGTDTYGQYVGFQWDDDDSGLSGSVFFDVTVTLTHSAVPPCPSDLILFYDSYTGYIAPPASFLMTQIASFSQAPVFAANNMMQCNNIAVTSGAQNAYTLSDTTGGLVGLAGWQHGGGKATVWIQTNYRKISLSTQYGRWNSSMAPFIFVGTLPVIEIGYYGGAGIYYRDLPMSPGETVTQIYGEVDTYDEAGAGPNIVPFRKESCP